MIFGAPSRDRRSLSYAGGAAAPPAVLATVPLSPSTTVARIVVLAWRLLSYLPCQALPGGATPSAARLDYAAAALSGQYVVAASDSGGCTSVGAGGSCVD